MSDFSASLLSGNSPGGTADALDALRSASSVTTSASSTQAQAQVFMGSTLRGTQRFTETGQGGVERGGKGASGGQNRVADTLPLTDAKNHWYEMSDEDIAHWAQQMYTLGYIDSPKDYLKAHSWWDTMVTESANMLAGGKQRTPLQAAEFYKGTNAASLIARADAGPGAHTTSNSINLLSQGDVRAMANQVLSQRLGRDATDAEVDTFFNTLNAKIKADPGSTTVVNDAAGKQQSSVSTPGFNANDANQYIEDYAQSNPQYAAYQGATTYFNAAMGALGPIGGA